MAYIRDGTFGKDKKMKTFNSLENISAPLVCSFDSFLLRPPLSPGSLLFLSFDSDCMDASRGQISPFLHFLQKLFNTLRFWR